MKPIFLVGNVHYTWIKHRNVYVVAVSIRNPNVTMIFSFLHKMSDEEYGGYDKNDDDISYDENNNYRKK